MSEHQLCDNFFSLYKQDIDCLEVSIVVFNKEFVAEHYYLNINSLTNWKHSLQDIITFCKKMCPSFKLVPWMGQWIILGEPFNYNRNIKTYVCLVFSARAIPFPSPKSVLVQISITKLFETMQLLSSMLLCISNSELLLNIWF